MRKVKQIAGCAVLLILAVASCQAQQPASAPPPQTKGVGIAQNMGQQVPLDLAFRDETGKQVHLGDFFGKKPVVLSLVYFTCPFMCTEVLNGEVRSLQNISLELGKDFEAVTVSFDPKDGPAEATLKEHTYEAMYARPAAAGGWHFLTGDQAAIQKLTDAVGFQYTYDKPSAQFAHAASIMILTPEGKIARYYYGIQYSPRDVRLGLVEASEGKISSPTDAALLLCYHYDPLTGKYGLVIANVLRIGGIATILVLGTFLWLLFRGERYEPVPAQNSSSLRGPKN